MTNKSIHIILCLFISALAAGQGCRLFHQSGACGPVQTRDGFRLYGQSKSALFEINQKSKFQVTFHGKKDYKIVSATEKGFEPVRMRVSDPASGSVFYDNIEDDYCESFGFSVEETQVLELEITLLSEKIEPEDFEENRACVGVLILWRKTPALGF